jgi:hypothetical protein
MHNLTLEVACIIANPICERWRERESRVSYAQPEVGYLWHIYEVTIVE